MAQEKEGHISDHYTSAKNNIIQTLRNERDDSSRLQKPDAFAEELFNSHIWEPIVFQGECRISTDKPRETVSDGFGGKAVDTVTVITIEQPIKPNTNAGQIIRHHGNTLSWGDLSEVQYRNGNLCQTTKKVGNLDDDTVNKIVKGEVDNWRIAIDRRNEAIEQHNTNLKEEISKLVKERCG